MSDWRLWRTTCEFCKQRVTVGAAGRVYKHNDKNGNWCKDGSWVRKIRPAPLALDAVCDYASEPNYAHQCNDCPNVYCKIARR